MINITFPDGSVRSYEQGITGLQIAESISPALARSVVSCGVNGETVELNRPINEDAKIALYKFEDEEGKHSFWHTSAHLLAEALKELYPGIQFGFGPAIEAGFFYDVLLPNGEQIKEGDFANIEKKMLELAKMDERNTARSSKPSKAAVANAELAKQMRDKMQENEVYTASALAELMEFKTEAGAPNTSKATAVVKVLVEDGTVVVSEIKVPKRGKCKAYSLATEDAE